jgi:hypothetical protein
MDIGVCINQARSRAILSDMQDADLVLDLTAEDARSLHERLCVALGKAPAPAEITLDTNEVQQVVRFGSFTGRDRRVTWGDRDKMAVRAVVLVAQDAAIEEAIDHDRKIVLSREAVASVVAGGGCAARVNGVDVRITMEK